MNKKSRRRNKERNKYARLHNAVMRPSKGLDPLGIPNVNFSVLGGYTDSPKDIEALAKYKDERVSRGFDDTECWNLDCTIAGFVLPRLMVFRDETDGYPPNFASFEEWREALDKMVYAFDHIYNDEKYSEELDTRLGIDWLDKSSEMKVRKDTYFEERKTEQARIDEGLELFGKHFLSLWW